MAISLKQVCSTFLRLFAYTIALRDIGVSSADITQNNYKVVKDQFNKPLCKIVAQPDKIVKLARSPIVCSGVCSSEEECVGFNYRSSYQECELFNQAEPMEVDVVDGCLHFALQNSLKDAGTSPAPDCWEETVNGWVAGGTRQTIALSLDDCKRQCLAAAGSTCAHGFDFDVTKELGDQCFFSTSDNVSISDDDPPVVTHYRYICP